MESWWIDYGPHQWVLRRLPAGMEDAAGSSEDGRSGIDLESEAEVIHAAVSYGVTAPEIVGPLIDADDLGCGFFMQRIAGETLPHKILHEPNFSEALALLSKQCANELAEIHSIDVDILPAGLPIESPQQIVEKLAKRYELYASKIPVFDLALNWLSNNFPTPRPRSLVHGDFRMGNLMINEKGIAGALDWEQAHIGDPVRDIAYLCMPSWRFGNYHKTAGGFGQLEELLAHYCKITGQGIPLKDVNFWMIVSSLTWGLGTIKMINLWRSGQDPSLERTVIGRRTSETEIDLLLMLEDQHDIAVPTLDWSVPEASQSRGETHNSELLNALITWDESSVLPNVKGRDLFQARVARNALRILLRDAIHGHVFARAKAERLDRMDMDQTKLCCTLANGQLNAEILSHLRFDLLERLHIDQPKYAGFEVAQEKWL